ncbi:Pestheic acid cluster transcriptional regulator 3 like protein [Verticillium longisporum]|nr:Pestheic acid cluster transcriptional regulator 3 like protein [Verticillium longisporum]
MDQSEPSFQDSWKAPMPRTASTVMREEEGDLNFIMIYLDHVFPFLFPYYRPSLPEGGRGWVLSLLKSNKAVYHTALSLGSYYFSLVLDNSGSGHGAAD